MDAKDFERLKESVRQMVAIKNGEAVPSRTKEYSGKVLVEIRENGQTVWTIGSAARALKEAVDAGEFEMPKNWAAFIKLLRETLQQSQQGFAELLGVPLPTLQQWEQGRREPKGPARTLLCVAARHPEAVLDTVTQEDFEVA